MKSKKILYNITEDWFFVSHFLSRAVAAKKRGYQIYVCCNQTKYRKLIENNDIKFIKLRYNRKSINPLAEFYILLKTIFIYKKFSPDIVHHIAFKPIIYGSIAAKLINIRSVINAPVGMGYVFTSGTLKANILRPLLKILLKIFLNSHHGKNKKNMVIFENEDDLKYFLGIKAIRFKDAIVIKGAGVDIDKSIFNNKKKNLVPIVTLVSRMLKDKGINEFVESARLLKDKKIKARFLLVGDVDPLNSSSIKSSLLKRWNDNKTIEWLGWIDDVKTILKQTDILCLPSYREGLPKALLEGAAIGLPIVTTNTVGCKDVVQNGINGILVPIKDSFSLSIALEKLIKDSALRKKMGGQSIKIATDNFSSTIIIKQTLEVYSKMVG